jgi:hypothetical protein
VDRKPNSVPPSRRPFGRRLRRMTIIPLAPPLLAGSSGLPGSFERAVLNASLFGLAPCGVLPATRVATGAVRSYRTFSPLPLDSPLRGSLGAGPRIWLPWACPERAPEGRVERLCIFCATILQVTLTGRYPAHCPSEFGLSSHLRALRALRWASPREPSRQKLDPGLVHRSVRRTRRWTIVWSTAAEHSNAEC